MTREQKMDRLRDYHERAISGAKEYGPSEKDIKSLHVFFLEQATSLAWAIKVLEAAE